MLNLASDMSQRPGLDPDTWYEAKVVSNNDPSQLGRIQARIATIFDGIDDADLPWAIPHWNHVDGASSTSGVFSVPKKQTKVFLKFQQGKSSFPMYRGYHVDKTTQMEEIKHNYPDRAVARFQNKALMVIDTKDNVVYIRNPGNVKIYIDGNVELEITGNVDEKIHGNVRRTVQGNLDEHIQGSLHRRVDGEIKESSGGTSKRYAGGTSYLESGAGVVIEGPTINENSGMGAGDPGASKDAQFTDWPGIPGGAKG